MLSVTIKARLLAIFLCISLLLVVACDDDESTNSPNSSNSDKQFETVVTFIDLDGFRINILGEEKPYVGYNRFRIEVRDNESNDLITPDAWQFLPTMDMGTHVHSAPRSIVDEDQFDIVFVMPSMMDRDWNLALNISINGKQYEQDFPLEVLQADYCKMVNDPAFPDGGNYAIVLKKEAWTIGMNDLEFMLYKRSSPMHFQPVEAATFTLEPDMPSMGHGSNNNVVPVATETAGQFRGAVNFTMSGRWRLTVGVEVPTLDQRLVQIEKVEMFVQVP